MQKIVKEAMAEFRSKTCVRFLPRRKEADYVVFYGKVKGCSSYLGRIGGAQRVRRLFL